MGKLQFRVLYREFLFRMVDLEVLSSHAQGDASKLIGRFAALLAFISIWMAFGAFIYAGSRMTPPVALALQVVTGQFLISTTMLLVGLFAVLSWDSTFPDRRDVLVLAPLPVRARTMFAAKVAAAASGLLLAVGLLHGAMGLVWPFAFRAHATPQSIPALTADPTPLPVSAADLQTVLTRDLKTHLTKGRLAPGGQGGLAVGVWKRGESRVFSYGTARPDSIFEVGSITKTFTGLILAQMAVQGKVTLDEPIRQLLPPGLVARPHADEITLLDIASQHSDLPRTVNGDWQEYMSRRGVNKRGRPPFAYSNFAFRIMGQMLATHDGLSYEELLRRDVTGPLGLTDTVVALSPEQRARLIPGYGGAGQPVPQDPEGAAGGAGAILSSPGDILRYLVANLHPDKLPGTLPEAMTMAHRPRAEGPPRTAICLAWFYTPEDGTWSHGGTEPGYTSFAMFNPRGDFAAVVLLNNGPDTTALADLLGDHIRQRLAGEPAISLDTAFVPASGNPLRWFFAYWFTMIASGVFIYCGVLSVQGLAAQLLPRRVFLRISGLLQMAAFCLFVCGYFLQPVFGQLTDLTAPGFERTLRWLPSYWFLGLFQRLNGSPNPLLDGPATRAWLGLAIVVTSAAAAYGLSYVRTLRQIVEQPDITPGVRRIGWLPPFGNRVQTAIGQFAVRTLARSRQHRMILAFYLGIGFAFSIFMLKDPALRAPVANDQWHTANTPLLAASIVMMALAIVGTRAVFALPLDLRANWTFRITGTLEIGRIVTASRRALLLLAAVPVWGITAYFCLRLWPWQQAAGHLLLLALLALILSDVCLLNFRKIPFTCSFLPGKSQFHLLFLGAIWLMWFVGMSVKFELDMLQQARSTATLVVPFVLAAIALRIFATLMRSKDDEVQFEESLPPAVMELGLHRDGFMPVGIPQQDPR